MVVMIRYEDKDCKTKSQHNESFLRRQTTYLIRVSRFDSKEIEIWHQFDSRGFGIGHLSPHWSEVHRGVTEREM